MAPRSYRMQQRGAAAEETRRRIVRATYELHAERGIAATSVRDIAARADVAVGTVYHHFPTYDDVINACGEYTLAVTRPPGPEALAGIRELDRRLGALVAEVFGYYRRFPGYARVRADRDRYPQLERFMQDDERNRRDMVAAAVAPRRLGAPQAALAVALLDYSVYRSLRDAGLDHPAAVAEAAHLFRRWLKGPARRSRRKESE